MGQVTLLIKCRAILVRKSNIMEKNNWLHNKISQSPDYILLGGILLFCLVYRLFYFVFLYPHVILYNSDSVSYFAPINILNGNIDAYRTPLYIYILQFFKILSGKNFSTFFRYFLIFQQTVSFLCIIPFYFISTSIVKNRYLAIITTLFYGCWHLILIHNFIINPESLCIAGSTLILFMFVKYFEKPSKYTAVAIGLFSFILIMLKPTYLILLCVVLVFLVIRFILFRQERKILYWGLLGWFVAVAGVLGYCEMNNRYNGGFFLSRVTLDNSLDSIIISGAYEYGGDEEFIALIDKVAHEDFSLYLLDTNTRIDEKTDKNFYISQFLLDNYGMSNFKNCYKRFPQYLPLTDDIKLCLRIPDTVKYPYARLSQFVNNSQYTMIYFKYIIKRMIDIFLQYIILFLIIILESIFIMYAFIKYRKIAWAQSFCILFVVGQLFSVAIGGIGYFHLRLFMPSYPFIIQIVSSFFGNLISFLRQIYT